MAISTVFAVRENSKMTAFATLNCNGSTKLFAPIIIRPAGRQVADFRKDNPKACKAIFERITNQGKSRKLALIAVCNKLLKQAFAIANSGVEYNENYRSKLVIIN